MFVKLNGKPCRVIFLFFLGIVLFTHAGLAQHQRILTPQLQSITKEKSHLNWMLFSDGNSTTINDLRSQSRGLLGLTDKDVLSLISSKTDEVGITNHKFIQTFGGLEVEGAFFHVQEKDNRLQSASGHLIQGLNVNTNPRINTDEALALALEYVPSDNYLWNSPADEQLLKQIKNDSRASYYPYPELLIANNTLISSTDPLDYILVFVIEVYASSPQLASRVYINAIDGSLVKEVNLLRSCSNGTASTRFNGTQEIVTKKANRGGFILLDECRGTGIHTMVQTKRGIRDVTDADNKWVAQRQISPASIHWAAEETYDYFLTDHNRDSYDDNGGYMLGVFGGFCDNAFWNGTYTSYGRGCNLAHTDLVSLDLVGHEWTHAVTQYSANLVYQNESGALNESFSDIFGTLVEAFAENGGDYLIGEDFWNANGKLRDMMNPKSKQNPDTYCGQFWFTGLGDNGGVHINSGVQNYWFYILAEGDSGVNDKGHAYNVEGIGADKAAQIAYRNLTVYLGPNSNYQAAADGSVQAAADLYGEGSVEYTTTIDAWCAVGVNPTILGGTPPCIPIINCLNGTFPGMPCDDFNSCTTNDAVQIDCSCQGVPVQCQWPLSCFNGNCQCDAFTNVGDACNDKNDCTINDQIQADCSCRGEPKCLLPSKCNRKGDCVCRNGNTVGEACDDGDACTTRDMITQNCQCEGTPIQCPPGEECEEGECVGCAEEGDACDDGDPCTTDDALDADCNCGGIPVDCPPGEECEDGECVGCAEEGDSCDDGNSCTTGDVLNADCECVGTPVDCPSGQYCEDGECVDCTEAGDSCDDGDSCTTGDILNADCECVGTPVDCPSGQYCEDGECVDCTESGNSCDDGDSCTSGDEFDADCNCIGIVVACPIGQQCVDGDCVDCTDSGDSCDDGNACTTGDVLNAECNCVGTLVECPSGQQCVNGDCEPCPSNGTSCDDGDPCTSGDTFDEACNCIGFTIACPLGQACSDGLCLEECDLGALQNDSCDDGNLFTVNDKLDENCICIGEAIQNIQSDKGPNQSTISDRLQVDVYPNPFKDYLTVSYSSEENTNLTIQLIDILGQVVQTKSISINKGALTMTMDDVSQLPEGVYILKSIDANGRTVNSTKLVHF